MAETPTSLEDKLAVIKKSYVEKLPQRMTELDDAIKAIDEAMPEDLGDAVEHLSSLAHKMAGSGATFGFEKITDTARDLEMALVRIIEEGVLSFNGVNQEVSKKFPALRDSVYEACDLENVELPSREEETEAEINEVEVSTNELLPEKEVLLIGVNPEDAKLLIDDLQNFGFKVTSIDKSSELRKVLETTTPMTILIEPTFPENEPFDPDLKLANDLRNEIDLDCLIVAISERNDILARLQAVRAKTDIYLLKPVSVPNLIDAIDQRSALDGGEDFRILIIDDDVSTAKYTEAVLTGAGMIVEIVNSPLEVQKSLDVFGPELILMDLYMPECNGMELAAVIRQQSNLAGIPIVFLSSELDVDKQLGAMNLGGDDFLTKPIRPQHLILSVRSRVKRFRMLRSKMLRDSMTGLLNHTTTHELLENEISRARRENIPVSVAVLDIDLFKSVNDTYGHAVGDQVIKALSRLLRQRLRSIDIIGRIGGEEFAVVLNSTKLDYAEVVFNGIRTAFSEIVHRIAEHEFSVTFSCGISEFPDYDNAVDLLDAADQALYEAKHTGRNRVILAPKP